MVLWTDSIKAMELGLRAGIPVRVLRNSGGDDVMLVEVGDMRLSLPRDLAELVRVAPAGRAGHNHPPARPRHGILRALRKYLRERGPVEAQTIAWHFDLDVAAVDGMLSFLEERGQVARQRPDTGCGNPCAGCSGCDALGPTAQPRVLWSLSQPD